MAFSEPLSPVQPLRRGSSLWRAAIFAVAALGGVAASVGCDDASAPAVEGLACTTSRDCGNGLECLPYVIVVSDGGCSSLGNQCLQPCKVDPDCNSGPSQGLGLICQVICATASACEVAPVPVDAAPMD
jgi:hypothetical protein